jgi:hypothetical protein
MLVLIAAMKFQDLEENRMYVAKYQMIDLVMKIDKPYRCCYCLYAYDYTCSPRSTCDVGVERFFSSKAKTLSQAIECAEDYHNELSKYRKENNK